MNYTEVINEIKKIIDEYDREVQNGELITYKSSEVEKLREYVDVYEEYNQLSKDMKDLEQKENNENLNIVEIPNAEGKMQWIKEEDVDNYSNLRTRKMNLKSKQTKVVKYIEENKIEKIIEQATEKEATREIKLSDEEFANLINQINQLSEEQKNILINNLSKKDEEIKSQSIEENPEFSPQDEIVGTEEVITPKINEPKLENLSIEELTNERKSLKENLDNLRNLTGLENADKVKVVNKNAKHEVYYIPRQKVDEAKTILAKINLIDDTIENKKKEQLKNSNSVINKESVVEKAIVTAQEEVPQTTNSEVAFGILTDPNEKTFRNIEDYDDELQKMALKDPTLLSKNYTPNEQKQKDTITVKIKKIKKINDDLREKFKRSWAKTKIAISGGLAAMATIALQLVEQEYNIYQDINVQNEQKQEKTQIINGIEYVIGQESDIMKDEKGYYTLRDGERHDVFDKEEIAELLLEQEEKRNSLDVFDENIGRSR